MNLLDSMNEAIQYIERNLGKKIDYAELPELECYSHGDCMSDNYKSESWIPII